MVNLFGLFWDSAFASKLAHAHTQNGFVAVVFACPRLRTAAAAAAAAENARSARVTDALLNWETVKYFTNESLEQEKYGEAIDGYQVCAGCFPRSIKI
jgi:ABC-type transport system involved in Fe-S cluster assembly fused permease/ATPase subunit